MRALATLFLLVVAILLALSESSPDDVDRSDLSLPSEDAEWVSLSEHESFVAVPDSDPRVRRAQRQLSVEYSSRFAGSETYYSEYSTAWRLLGTYIDCNVESDHRRLEGDGQDGQDGGDDDLTGDGCQRNILWAAYVDLDYQGGGIGEYQFYNTANDEWDTSACEATNNARCAKMDCHLPTTHFKLLGFYKQNDLGDWTDQLFKHQAFCLWSDSQYEFMQEARDWWPKGCTSTGKKDGRTPIYMDVKPGVGGTMELGLYTDSACTIDYTRGRVKLGTEQQYVDKWNEALGIFRVCQPCKAYSLSELEQKDDAEGDDNNGRFTCDDDAGYKNVNQCMKFRTKTDARPASYKEVALASFQGSIVSSNAADVAPTFWGKWGHLIIGILLFVAGVVAFIWAARPPRVTASNRINVSREPLMRPIT